MSSIIISIHKQYCDALFSGKKRFEFRKTIPSHRVSHLLVYEAKGCGKVIGKLEVTSTIIGTPEEIWIQTQKLAGIDKDSFFSYYNGKRKAIAYVIGAYERYSRPKPLSDYGLSRPPQNFVWIEK